MGKISRFDISIDGNKQIFFPGDSITGNLYLTLADSMEMRKISIKCKGKANVHWTETRTVSTGKSTTTYTESYNAREKYFSFSNNVVGKGINGQVDDKTTLSAGDHIYPFSFQLPSQLPSTFEGGVGWVRYHIKAEIDRPWKFNHKGKQMFTVLDRLDLNLEPNARAPSGRNDSKTLCCWCCASGPIEADIHTDRTGYVPGDTIIINGTIENHSNSKVKGSKCYINQEVKFITTRKTKTVNKTIESIRGGGCGRHGTVTWRNQKLQIPPVPPSDMRHCNIMDINYTLVMEGELRTCAVNLRAPCPITIGTVPLQGVGPYTPEDNGEAEGAHVNPTAPQMPQPDIPPPTTYNPPPPSYMAAVGTEPVDIKTSNDQYLMGNTTYTPQYAYYDWNQSAFTYK